MVNQDPNAAEYPRLDADLIRAELGDPSVSLTVLESVTSTNTLVLDHIDVYPHCSVLLAEQQTAGRGRRGKAWVSPSRRNLYFTLAWDWPHDYARLQGLSIAVGVALADAFEILGLDAVQLKWPNDVLWRDKKLSGILIETKPVTNQPMRVAVGVGINVLMAPTDSASAAIGQPWASLQQAGCVDSAREHVAAVVISSLVAAMRSFADAGLDAMRERWAARDWLRGCLVECGSTKGIAVGVDAHGALIIDVDGVYNSVSAGEVSVRRRTEGESCAGSST